MSWAFAKGVKEATSVPGTVPSHPAPQLHDFSSSQKFAHYENSGDSNRIRIKAIEPTGIRERLIPSVAIVSDGAKKKISIIQKVST